MVFQLNIIKKIIKDNRKWILWYFSLFVITLLYFMFFANTDYQETLFLTFIIIPSYYPTEFIYPILIIFNIVFSLYILNIYFSFELNNFEATVLLRKSLFKILQSKNFTYLVLLVCFKFLQFILGYFVLNFEISYLINVLLRSFLLQVVFASVVLATTFTPLKKQKLIVQTIFVILSYNFL